MDADYIRATFEDFLDKYKPNVSNNGIYGSVYVNYEDIKEHEPNFATDLLNNPEMYLESMNQVAKSLFEGLEDENITVRIYNLPSIKIRKLNSRYINKMICLNGIVNMLTPSKPMVKNARFECQKCGEGYSIPQLEPFMIYPVGCKSKGCRRGFPKFLFKPDQSTFIDCQELSIQEKPEELPAGRMPRKVRIILYRDAIEKVRAGDVVTVNGILRVNQTSQKTSKTVFDVFIECNNVEVKSKDISEITITPEEEESFKEMAKNPDIYEKCMSAIVPSVYGNERVKEAIMYLLFGGVKKELPDINIRGEINVLLIGDPSTAKSQLLKGTSKISPRAIFTSGRGTTAAGLTAAVVKTTAGQWALEAGVLVLGDRGIVCIDEMDKMNENDRVAIHEAMEQHTVSISKAGIVATLNARTAILGAANPTYGRYDKGRSIAENLTKFPTTLLSRFDLIFIMKDIPSEIEDRIMAGHVLSLRRKDVNPLMSVEMFRKYVSYARKLKPTINEESEKKIMDFYVEKRKQMGARRGDDENPIAVTPRQLESIARLAEAHARIALRDKVEEVDADAAIELMQKSLKDVGMEEREIGRTKKDVNIQQLIIDILKEYDDGCSPTDLKKELMDRKYSAVEADKLIKRAINAKWIYNEHNGYYKPKYW